MAETKICKLEMTKEGKSNPRKLYELIKYKHHHYPIIFPETFKNAEILEGDGGSTGSIELWKYVVTGTSEVLIAKERIDEADDEKMFVALNVLEGDVMNHYKHYAVKIQVNSKEEGYLVKCTIEFEKIDQSFPDPHEYMDLYAAWIDKLDAHLVAKGC
ncbi:Mlp-like protein [Thalictrum thalictroides]|uniref:Mlp-like protein n=1 Tax=Thalictrum thalictroides TaxID=46969 RepID=A0A7J6UTN9_THATH|nr:Mlp-like protein [Thalictrum thalictroides]